MYMFEADIIYIYIYIFIIHTYIYIYIYIRVYIYTYNFEWFHSVDLNPSQQNQIHHCTWRMMPYEISHLSRTGPQPGLCRHVSHHAKKCGMILHMSDMLVYYLAAKDGRAMGDFRTNTHPL